MNLKPNKKPFGLSLAAKIAADALKQSVAPQSIILGNLLLLQKETHFPKELNTHYFSFQKKIPSDSEKKNIVVLLDALKKPQENIAAMLENTIAADWVVKKVIPATVDKKSPVSKKPAQHKKPTQKVVNKAKEVVAPVVVVKKSKFTI